MSDEFFHLDRLGKVDEDTTFKLNLSNAHPSHAVQELSNAGIYKQIGHEEYDFIEEYFGEGLTAHGMAYLYPNFPLSREILTRFQGQLSPEAVVEILSQTQVPENWHIEIILELVRRSDYDNNISRFQSVFGANSMEDLENWMNLPNVKSNNGDVFYVVPDSFCEKDAGHLNYDADFDEMTDLAEHLIETAHSYWSGQSAEPAIPEVLLVPEVQVIEHVESLIQ